MGTFPTLGAAEAWLDSNLRKITHGIWDPDVTTNRPSLRGLFFDWSDDEQAWALQYKLGGRRCRSGEVPYPDAGQGR